MGAAPSWSFGPFCLDPANACLWRETQAIALTPKAFAVLQYLVEAPGRLVTKAELLEAVWPDTAVGEEVLKVCISRIRRALGDRARTPEFIQTVHWRGYRFIGTLSEAGRSAPLGSIPPSATPSWVVGREKACRELGGFLAQALAGERQVVFVTGEPGIGKTTVVEAFVASLAEARLWVARGQCVDQYGSGAAYMPVLEALEQLGRGPGGARVGALLQRYAPTWLVHMPWLLSAAERTTLQRGGLGTTRERMLQELVQALEGLTAERPLVLVLEDLHWSDYATLDVVTALAQRQAPARLVVLGTYRPGEVVRRRHPLRTIIQELRMHGHCRELPLPLLSEAEVEGYLQARWPGTAWRAGLARWLHTRTEGNPLFLVTVVEDLVRRGVVAEEAGQWALQEPIEALEPGVPSSLQGLIERQLDELSMAERAVLEAGSVAGEEFSAVAVAAGLGSEVWAIEGQCAAVARRGQLLQRRGEQTWPDGTVATCYSFGHMLYRHVVYQEVTAAHRRQLHQRIGARLEAGYGAQAHEIAAQLAMHFAQGGDPRRAVDYGAQAAQNALRQHANREAIAHLTRGLELLQRLPESPERSQRELALHIMLGAPLLAMQGSSAPEVERVYARARDLCLQVGETRQLFTALRGLWDFHLLKADCQTARELGEQLLSLGQRLQDAALLVEAQRALGTTLYWLGEMAPACAHLQQSMALYDPQQHSPQAFLYGQDSAVACLAYLAWAMWHCGYPDQALQRSHESLALARKLAHPFSLAYALTFAARLHQFRGEPQAVQALVAELMLLATAHGFPHWSAHTDSLQGWLLTRQGQVEAGIAQIHQGLAAYRATGGELARSYLLPQLAEAYGNAGQHSKGLRLLAEALRIVHNSGGHCLEAELYRLKGEFLRRQAAGKGGSRSTPVHEAEACFRQALDVARRQQAKSLELRAAMSLTRLWQQQGKRTAARRLLAEMYGWFTEGFDTTDLQEAKALLDTLSHHAPRP